MICLSKADEGTFKHLTFNQSPSPLAASSTTRQDLNGISNLREHVASCQDEDDAGGGTSSSADEAEKWYHQGTPPGDVASRGDVGDGVRHVQSHRLSVSCCREASTGGDDQSGLLTKVTDPALLARLWGWLTWLASVLLMSFIIAFLFAPHTRGSELAASAAEPDVVPTLPAGDVVVVQDLRKRSSSTCAANSVDSADYDLPLHVGALIIIWFVSTTACAFPLLARKFPGLHIPQRFFFAVRHFGTGVLIATSFAHLLPTAFISLGDPCLSSFWTSDYPAMPGAIAMTSVFFVTVIEMVFHPSRRCTSMPPVQVVSQPNTSAVVDERDYARAAGPQNLGMREMAPPKSRTSSVGHGLNRLPTLEETRPPAACSGSEAGRDSDSEEQSALKLSPEMKLRKERLQCVLLELGILFHSVFIGMALSVSVGNPFIVLLIAIVFHQTFEGLALGARIAAINWPTSNKRQPWLMAFAYGCTTPIGQAIGLATHTLYAPGSEIGLIVVGVMNAISSGLLIFASLVELLAEDFLSDESWTVMRGRKRVVACGLVFLGAFCMSLVGAWA